MACLGSWYALLGRLVCLAWAVGMPCLGSWYALLGRQDTCPSAFSRYPLMGVILSYSIIHVHIISDFLIAARGFDVVYYNAQTVEVNPPCATVSLPPFGRNRETWNIIPNIF